MIRNTIAGVAAVVLAAGAAGADTRAGVDAWGRGDYARAVEEWRAPAAAGDADAQFNLAQAYKLGRGVPADLVQAEEWYRRAALQGHPQAEDNYGLALFQNGRRDAAVSWLEKSANRGEPRAQYVLGTMYFNGDIVRRDWPRAYALMTRASGSGLAQATRTLGEMDRYIPITERQAGIDLARRIEGSAARPIVTADAAPAVTSAAPPAVPPAAPRREPRPMQSAELPPSRVDPAPVQTPPPAPAPVAVAEAPRPAPRPAPRAPARPRPAGIVSGPWAAQLGAFRDTANAQRMQASVGARGAFNGRVVTLVPGGGVTRVVVVGFASPAAVRAACAAAGIAPCAPVRS